MEWDVQINIDEYVKCRQISQMQVNKLNINK